MELLRLIGAVALFFGYYSVGSAGGLPAHSDHTHSPIASECGNEPSPTADRVPKDSRQGEHSAALNLVAICSVTHTAVKSGAWTDPTTWLDGKVPVAEARVHIPNGARVTIDSDFAPAIDWVRIYGTLTWSG